MKRKELIEEVSQETGLTKEQTAKALDSLLDILKATLRQGETISIKEFGTFSVKERKERWCINPDLGTNMLVPARMVARFKPSEHLINAKDKNDGTSTD